MTWTGKVKSATRSSGRESQVNKKILCIIGRDLRCKIGHSNMFEYCGEGCGLELVRCIGFDQMSADGDVESHGGFLHWRNQRSPEKAERTKQMP